MAGTLADMKDRIAREVRRKTFAALNSDMQTAISDAISTAILAYQPERFFFNESRDNTFSTVANQEFYTLSDAAFIGDIRKIDYANLLVGNTTFTLIPDFPAEIESASTNATAVGQPGWYLYYGRKIRLYPIPSDVWTVRIAGVFRYAEPATDDEADNFWMTDGEMLIRSRAKYELALHILYDDRLAQTMAASTTEAVEQLKRFSNRVTQRHNGFVRAMDC